MNWWADAVCKLKHEQLGFSMETLPHQFWTQKLHQQINFDFVRRIPSNKHCIDILLFHLKFPQIYVRDFPQIFHITSHDPEISFTSNPKQIEHICE